MTKKELFKQIQIIIPAGGSGLRFGENKLLCKINNVEVFIHTLRPFLDLFQTNQIFIVVPKMELEIFKKLSDKYLKNSEINFVVGGNTRAQSVANGLYAGDSRKNFKYVIIHDAARPLITTKVIEESLSALVNFQNEFSGVVVAKKVVDTIKCVDDKGCFVKTLNRDSLWAMETPQVFVREKFKIAYDNILSQNVDLALLTDDAAIMTESDFKVKPFDNESINCKITYRQDLELAEFLLRKKHGE